MSTLNLLAAGVIALSFVSSAANAEQKKGPPAPAGETVRYFQLADEFLGDLPAEGYLKEVRQGPRLTSAVIDICHSVSTTTSRKDRFTINLKVEGTRMTGSGQTQETKSPVSVNLVRKPMGKSVTFEGSITLAGEKIDMSSADNTEMNEKEFEESQATESSIVAEPADFIELSPGALSVQVKREQIPAVLKAIKAENVEFMLESLAQDCNVLRTGQQELQFLVDPARAPAVVKKLKGLPGVTDAGWIGGAYSIDRSVRLELADWKGGNSFDKQKVGTAIANSIAKNFKATVDSTEWNAATGELKVVLKRNSLAFPGLGLSDRLDVVLLIGPETPKGNEGLIVWLRDISIDVVDGGAEPKMKFVAAASEESGLLDEEELFTNLAKDLKGKRWDSDQGAWE
jgi:hypothetical protein